MTLMWQQLVSRIGLTATGEEPLLLDFRAYLAIDAQRPMSNPGVNKKKG